MRIGPYEINSSLIVAPMAGVTDLPFRRLCKRHGAGMSVSEMVSADSTLWGSRKTMRRLEQGGERGPVSVQIVGADPAKMAEAARLNVDRGARIIDINMGCPAKKVCKAAAGSALLRDEILAGRIMEAVVNAVEVPVTLKIRTGWDPEHRNGATIARIAEQAGIQALAVHGRTRACGFSGRAEYDTIRKIKKATGIPVIANGDITSPETAQQVLSSTGADGIMIGRAARGRPWIFQEIGHYLETGERWRPPSLSWIHRQIAEHVEAIYAFYGDYHGVRLARKHIAWYSKTYQGGAAFRERINQVETPRVQLGLIDEYFAQLAENKELAA